MSSDGMYSSVGYDIPMVGTVGYADWAFMCGYGGLPMHSEGNVQLFE